MQEWYAEMRQDVERVFTSRTPTNEPPTISRSPSGKYALEVVVYGEGPGTWDFSRGLVRHVDNDDVIADVKRNYSAFPFSWCEGHPSGHDYLVCGEDYQGQTLIELNTRRRVDFIDDAAKDGAGFCWAAHYPSPDGRRIFVDGCIWACEYELILFDFNDPTDLPYREIKRWPVSEVQGFESDGSFVFEHGVDVRLSDGKPLDEMDEEELDAFEAHADYWKLCGAKRIQVRWHPGGTEEVRDLGVRESS